MLSKKKRSKSYARTAYKPVYLKIDFERNLKKKLKQMTTLI